MSRHRNRLYDDIERYIDVTIRQADIAREIGRGEMVISRAVKALGCDSRPLSDFDAFRLLFATELQNLGLAPHVVFQVMAEFPHETRFVYQRSQNQAWLIFVDNEKANFRTSALSENHLAALCDLFPLSLVLPLHSIAERARQRLAVLKARKVAA